MHVVHTDTHQTDDQELALSGAKGPTPALSTVEGTNDQKPSEKPSVRIERALLDLPIVKADGSVVFPMVEIYLHDDGTMKAGRVSIYEAPRSAAPADDTEATLRRNALHELRIGRYDDAAIHLQDLLALRLSRLGGGA